MAINTSFGLQMSDPLRRCPDPDVRQISLRDAVRTQLGRLGLPEMIRAIIRGEVVPTGKTISIPGIMGHLFRLEDAREYRPRQLPKVAPAGWLTYAEAAVQLRTNTEVVRNIVAQGLMRAPRRRIRGLTLVRAEDVERFASQFIAVSSLAARFNTRSEWVARYLREQGMEVLAIHMPGKGKKLFVDREAVAGVSIPTAKRAIVAAAS